MFFFKKNKSPYDDNPTYSYCPLFQDFFSYKMLIFQQKPPKLENKLGEVFFHIFRYHILERALFGCENNIVALQIYQSFLPKFCIRDNTSM